MNDELRAAFVNFFKKQTKLNGFVGTVKDYSETEKTCIVLPIDGGPEFFDVKLKPSLDGNTVGFWVLPKKGSVVIVEFIGGDERNTVLSMFTETDKILIESGGTIVFNNGSNDGLVLINALVKRLNDIETQHNKLLNDFVSHIHIDPLSGSTGIITIPPVSTSLIPTKKTDIENTKILQ